MTIYAAPGSPDSLVQVQPRYGHFIGGNWVDPKKGQWFENISPVNGKPFTEIARGYYRDLRVFERLEHGGHFTIAEVPGAMAERFRAFLAALP